MNRLSRYIFAQIMIGLVFVTLALTCAVWLTQSLRFIDKIVNRGLPLSVFFDLTLLLLPSFILFILPIALFASVAFLYGKLTVDREIVVMRTTGLSNLALARPALVAALVVSAACFALSLYLAPTTYRTFKDMQFQLRADYSSVLLREGIFDSVRKDITVFVRARASRGELQGILVHDARDPKKPVTLMAERGILLRTPEGPQVVMIKGNRQEVNDRGQVNLLYFDRYVLDLGLSGEAPENRWHEARERYLPDLFWPDPSSSGDRFYRDKLISEGHRRLVTPLYALAYAFIGVGIILSAPFSRRGLFVQIAIAVALVGATEGSGMALNNLAVKLPAVAPFQYLTAVVPILLGLWLLLRRPRLRSRGGPSAPESAR
ncbi:MAG: LPS export ABC transporter permease LptF [Alphaproteobacteria bacterium]